MLYKRVFDFVVVTMWHRETDRLLLPDGSARSEKVAETKFSTIKRGDDQAYLIIVA